MPNPASDAEWDEWELTRFFAVTKTDIIRLGKHPLSLSLFLWLLS
jgi:hypothetical protein